MERVSAATAQEAKEILEQRGWTNLRLHKGEVTDFVSKQVRAASRNKQRAELTPEQELAYHRKDPGVFWSNWWLLRWETRKRRAPILQNRRNISL